MLVSEEYPWRKLLREYAMYCGVGCFNVAVFFVMYIAMLDVRLSEDYPAASAWAVSYFFSSILAHYMHRWLTFESPSPYGKSLFVTLTIYSVLLLISTASMAYFSDTMGVDEILSWAVNTAAFGFLTFLALRLFAFPLADGRISRKERLDAFRERRRA